MSNNLFFLEVYDRYKPSKKLPIEFEESLKESCLSMMAEVQRWSVEKYKQTLLRQFPYFVDQKPVPDVWLGPYA